MAITSYGLQYKVPLLVDLDMTKYILWTYRFLGCMTKTNNSKPLFSNRSYMELVAKFDKS